MKRFATISIAFVLAALVLVSFTGLRLLIHHCFACETTDVVWAAFAPESCEELHTRHKGQDQCTLVGHNLESDSCCGLDGTDHLPDCHNCCDTEHQYVKTDLRVTQDKNDVRILPHELDVKLTGKIDFESAGFSTESGKLLIPSEPPPVQWGRDFLIFSQQLKYC